MTTTIPPKDLVPEERSEDAAGPVGGRHQSRSLSPSRLLRVVPRGRECVTSRDHDARVSDDVDPEFGRLLRALVDAEDDDARSAAKQALGRFHDRRAAEADAKLEPIEYLDFDPPTVVLGGTSG